MHPDKEQLVAFGLGRLEPDKADSIESHLQVCHECCETLLDIQDDTFVALVRRAPDSDHIVVEQPVSENSTPTESRIEDAVRKKDTTNETIVDSASDKSTVELPAELANHSRYHVLELIGHGGMGDVYKAKHRVMNRAVALKVINQDLVRNSQAVERFRREAQAAARLSHPNIVTAHDAEQAGNVHYLVMEFVDGTNLSDVVKERGPLSVSEACDFIQQATAGLQHAANEGMVHRDIKPHNLMVTGDAKIKILDFGLATLADPLQKPTAVDHSSTNDGAIASGNSGSQSLPEKQHHLTSAGTMMGTPDYISPEQAGDARSVDIRSDIYSLGCTLYFLLTGRPPFDEGSVMDRVKAHAERNPAPIESIRANVPAELADVIQKMMAKEPNDRFQTPVEIADALAPFVDRHRSDDGGGTPSGQPAASTPSHLPPLIPVYAIGSLCTVAFVLSFGTFQSLVPDAPSWLLWWLSIGGTLSLPYGVAILLLADRGERRQSYQAVTTASRLSLFPMNPFSVVLLPLAVWSASTLRRPEIRQKFESGTLPKLDEAESRRRWPMIAAIVASIVIVLWGVIFITTDRGTLEIESVDDSVQIFLSRITSQDRDQDSNVTVETTFVDTLTGSVVKTLRSGEYFVRLQGDDNDFELSRQQFVLKRGGKVVLRVTRKVSTSDTASIPQPVATSETKQAIEEFVAAARSVTNDVDWESVIRTHAPILIADLESESEEFGETEFALMATAGREMVELFTKLPDEVLEDFQQIGYLKWKFVSLDEARQQSMQAALGNIIRASKNMGFPPGLQERAQEMLLSADVGYLLLSIPNSTAQGVFWYVQMPTAPIPMMMPIFGTSADGTKDLFSRSVYAQLGELEDKPYSDIKPMLFAADMERLQGAWQFVRGGNKGEPVSPRKLEIAANVWLMKDPQSGQTIERMTFEIDPSQTPKKITLTAAGMPQAVKAIYRFEGEELHFAAPAAPTGERPLQFDESGFFAIMKREAPMDRQRIQAEDALQTMQQRTTGDSRIAYVVWASDGKAALRFGQWNVVFTAIDADEGLIGMGAFRVPRQGIDDSKRTGGGASFGTGGTENRRTVKIDDRIVDGESTISVNDVKFKMLGRAETLDFGDGHHYQAGESILTIVVAADGKTRIQLPNPPSGVENSSATGDAAPTEN